MKKEQKEHFKLMKHLESYNKRRFNDMMKRWNIARTFNYKDMNFGECLDEYEKEKQERRRKEKEARRRISKCGKRCRR